MTITWINCSERMPPDDDTKIIVFYAGRMIDTTSGDIMHAGKALTELTGKKLSFEWTPYTEEAWSELNR